MTPPAAVTARMVASSITSRSRNAAPAMPPWTMSTVRAESATPGSQRGGEGDRGDPVEHRLDGEQLHVAGQAVLERSEDA